MNWLIAEKVHSKRAVVSMPELLELSYDRELYSSHFHFGDEMRQHLMDKGSVAGYQGPVRGEYFCLDIDSRKNIDELKGLLIPMLEEFERMDMSYYLFFSGFKGFHLYVPKQYIAYPPELEDRWHEASKLFARAMGERFPELEPFIDLSVYDMVRLFRFPFSTYPVSAEKKKHFESRKTMLVYDSKSGSINAPKDIDERRVIETIFGGMHLDPEEVEQWFELKYDEKIVNEQPPVGSVDGDPYEFPYGEKLCIYQMLNERIAMGSRHKMGLRLQAFFKEKGYPQRVTEGLIRDWNSQLNPHRGDGPMTEEELQNIFRYYAKGYSFPCDDEIKRRYCVPGCSLHRVKDLAGGGRVFTGDKYIEAYKEMLAASTENDIVLSHIYPDFMPLVVKPDGAHIVVVAAGPAVGKTTFMENVAMRCPHIDWLFLSYDMAANTFTAGIWDLLGLGDINDPAECAKFKAYTKHIITIDDPLLKIGDVGDVIRMVNSQYGVNVKALILDYLQIIPAQGANATERAITISKSLRTLAKEFKVAPFVLSQVPKEAAGDGNQPISMQAPKDSGEITNLADLQLNLWRPNRMRLDAEFGEPAEDDVLRALVAKYRHGEDCYTVDLAFDKKKHLISPMQHRIKLASA